MSDTVIQIENVSKRYVLGDGRAAREGLRHRLEGWIRNPLGWLRSQAGKKVGQREFWALKDISFEIKQGDVVGIIGRNGAGKSTLLKVLSRITEPTEGRIRIRGRVASLLEVGTGFHPELTGRENIFLNGSILGMTRAEIRQKFDEIVAFSEVERFLDTPVKRYSSGMYVRLAFAVAAHLEPEILIVDEVLAVGDAQFQKKCMGKMRDVSRGGRTVLFVSHNMAAVMQLTNTAIVLNQGVVRFRGPSTEAVEHYLGAAAQDQSVRFDVEHAPRKYAGTQAARMICLRFNRNLPYFAMDEDFVFLARIRAAEEIARIRFSITIFDAEGNPVGSCFGREMSGLAKGDETEYEVTLPCPRLAPGRYYCGLAIGKGDNLTGHVDYDVVLDTMHFEVRPAEGADGTLSTWARNWGTIVFPELVHKKVPCSMAA